MPSRAYCGKQRHERGVKLVWVTVMLTVSVLLSAAVAGGHLHGVAAGLAGLGRPGEQAGRRGRALAPAGRPVAV